MAIEIFALLTPSGEHNGDGYIFCGKTSDLASLAKPVYDAYEQNRRKKKLVILADKITAASKLPVPLVRLDKAEAAVLMDAIADMAEGKPASSKYAKLYARVADSLCVY